MKSPLGVGREPLAGALFHSHSAYISFTPFCGRALQRAGISRVNPPVTRPSLIHTIRPRPRRMSRVSVDFYSPETPEHPRLPKAGDGRNARSSHQGWRHHAYPTRSCPHYYSLLPVTGDCSGVSGGYKSAMTRLIRRARGTGGSDKRSAALDGLAAGIAGFWLLPFALVVCERSVLASLYTRGDYCTYIYECNNADVCIKLRV